MANRDSSVSTTAGTSRCPYCHKVWLQLEEKRIPYTIEKINMRCYGDKPASFMAKVPAPSPGTVAQQCRSNVWYAFRRPLAS